MAEQFIPAPGPSRKEFSDLQNDVTTLNDQIGTLNGNITPTNVSSFATVVESRSSFNANYNHCMKAGKTVQIDIDITSQTTTNQSFLKLAESICPVYAVYVPAIDYTDRANGKMTVANIATNGDVSIIGFTSGHEYMIHTSYFCN